MPVVRKTQWDHVTLPYVPPRPCLLYYLIPGDAVPRVMVPNARGEYPQLIPGMPYLEEADDDDDRMDVESALPVLEYPPPAIVADAGTQVEWADLPIPPLEHLQRFESSSAHGEDDDDA